MYADSVTPSMARAIEETTRRRERQMSYNRERGLDPQPLRKKIADITDLLAREDADTEQLANSDASDGRGRRPRPTAEKELEALIEDLSAQMHQAASDLHFELAARLRDEVHDLKKELRGMREAVGT